MRAERVYLDWNATAPLRPEARAAMIAAMDVVGNPSSVHSEGRAARSLVEKARGQIAEAIGALSADIVFTSGATEAAALAMAGRRLFASPVEHDAIAAWVQLQLATDNHGLVSVDDPGRCALQLANSESGVIQTLPGGLAVSDLTQGIGRIPFAFDWSGIEMGILSAHKFGGPKGIGALVLKRNLEVESGIKGGGQEMGRRSGTENVIAIAGFAAAITAAMRDLQAGVWEKVSQFRNILELSLASENKETILIGKDARRLPNTLLVATPGWKGETQVMQMDLAGFAISAGSACSSGKARKSRVVEAMGYGEDVASGAIRVSLGPDTTEEQVLRFADAWTSQYRKRKARAA